MGCLETKIYGVYSRPVLISNGLNRETLLNDLLIVPT